MLTLGYGCSSDGLTNYPTTIEALKSSVAVSERKSSG